MAKKKQIIELAQQVIDAKLEVMALKWCAWTIVERLEKLLRDTDCAKEDRVIKDWRRQIKGMIGYLTIETSTKVIK